MRHNRTALRLLSYILYNFIPVLDYCHQYFPVCRSPSHPNKNVPLGNLGHAKKYCQLSSDYSTHEVPLCRNNLMYAIIVCSCNLWLFGNKINKTTFVRIIPTRNPVTICCSVFIGLPVFIFGRMFSSPEPRRCTKPWNPNTAPTTVTCYRSTLGRLMPQTRLTPTRCPTPGVSSLNGKQRWERKTMRLV